MPIADMIHTETPEGKKELGMLEKLGPGEIFPSGFMPGVPEQLEWVVSKIEPNLWEFQGYWCSIPAFTATIERENNLLKLSLKEGQ